MKVVVCPDSFKGSLSSVDVAESIERGILRALGDNGAQIVKIPLADGGEGTVESLVGASRGKLRRLNVRDPLLRDVEAFLGFMGDGTTAVIEMASASGLCLLSENERNPLITSTYGTGELLLAAANSGARKIIIGIGGSATNDGGAGAMSALGARFLDDRGDELPTGGGALIDLARIDMSGFKFPDQITVEVACDVTNPLCGDRGASAVYGPQKGADPEMVAKLDAALHKFAEVVRRELGKDVADMPGAGAAGGLGVGLAAFLGAQLRSGIDIVLDAVGFDEAIVGADLIITGEGRIDSQTVYGKVVSGVLKRSKAAGIPVVALAGSLAEDIEPLYDAGLSAAFSIVPGPINLRRALANATRLVESTAERVFRLVRMVAERKRQ